jgi:hypothetical protein
LLDALELVRPVGSAESLARRLNSDIEFATSFMP